MIPTTSTLCPRSHQNSSSKMPLNGQLLRRVEALHISPPIWSVCDQRVISHVFIWQAEKRAGELQAEGKSEAEIEQAKADIMAVADAVSYLPSNLEPPFWVLNWRSFRGPSPSLVHSLTLGVATVRALSGQRSACSRPTRGILIINVPDHLHPFSHKISFFHTEIGNVQGKYGVDGGASLLWPKKRKSYSRSSTGTLN